MNIQVRQRRRETVWCVEETISPCYQQVLDCPYTEPSKSNKVCLLRYFSTSLYALSFIIIFYTFSFSLICSILPFCYKLDLDMRPQSFIYRLLQFVTRAVPPLKNKIL